MLGAVAGADRAVAVGGRDGDRHHDQPQAGLRVEKRAEELAVDTGADPEATARVKAFLARMIRPGGALPPQKR